MAHEDDLMKQKGTDFQEDSNQEEFTLPEEPTDESHTEGSEFEDDLDLGLGDDTGDDDLTFEEDGVYDETNDKYGEDHGDDLATIHRIRSITTPKKASQCIQSAGKLIQHWGLPLF